MAVSRRIGTQRVRHEAKVHVVVANGLSDERCGQRESCSLLGSDLVTAELGLERGDLLVSRCGEPLGRVLVVAIH